MKSCDSCRKFIKHNFNDGRIGLCDKLDVTIKRMPKSCKHCKRLKYKRQK